jgi:dienelactone hydrolase
MKQHLAFGLLLAGSILVSCNNNNNNNGTMSDAKTPVIKEEAVTYTVDSMTMHGFVAYDSNSSEKRPAVLVVPEWWGLNDYTKSRAKQLAGLGYIAFAVDMYGEGKIADDPGTAQKFATPFYSDPQMAKKHFDAALAEVKKYAQTDTSRIAAIGYCFGGSMVLNAAKLGDNLKGVVSFHGDLAGVPANKDLLKAAILVCHGMDDKFVSAETVAAFKKQMDSVKADFTFREYPGATHAFTNPNATKIGQQFNMPIAYNAAADTASWKEMRIFFDRIFK